MGVLHAICDREEATCGYVRATYPEVLFYYRPVDLFCLKELDAVVIATNTESHYRLASGALLASLDVLVEKPMATTVEEAERLIKLAGEQQRVLMAGHVFLYNTAVHKLKELMLDIGPVRYIYSQRLATFPPREHVGVLLDLAIHDVSIVQWLTDSVGTKVHVSMSDLTGNGLEDFASLHLLMANVDVWVDVSWMYPHKVRQMVVVGKEKTLVWDDMAREFKLEVHEAGTRSLIALPDDEPLRRELEHFLACCANRTQPFTDGKSALKVLEVLL